MGADDHSPSLGIGPLDLQYLCNVKCQKQSRMTKQTPYDTVLSPRMREFCNTDPSLEAGGRKLLRGLPKQMSETRSPAST
jgi:hypothetical protein